MYRNCFSMLALFVLLAVSACDFDNYEPPASTLRGAVVYEGERLGVRQNGVDLEMWEEGYELRNFIPLNVYQDGTFAAELFEAEYQIVPQAGDPWVQTTDSVVVRVDGNSMNVVRGPAEVVGDSLFISVTPYFVFRDVDISFADNTVTANFDIEQVVDDASIEQVQLYVNRTQFVGATGGGSFPADSESQLPFARQLGSELDDLSNISLSFPLTEEQRGDLSTLYARVAVFSNESTSPEGGLYSRVVALQVADE